MKARYLGHSCVEIIGTHHVLIDPDFTRNPEPGVEYICISHAHKDYIGRVAEVLDRNCPCFIQRVWDSWEDGSTPRAFAACYTWRTSRKYLNSSRLHYGRSACLYIFLFSFQAAVSRSWWYSAFISDLGWSRPFTYWRRPRSATENSSRHLVSTLA